MNLPKMPTKNVGVLPELVKTVEEIIKFLPSLITYGDNNTTFVNETAYGRIIRSKAQGHGGIGGQPPAYDGPFACKMIKEEGKHDKIKINGGFFNRNGRLIVKKSETIDCDSLPKSNVQYICIHQTLDEERTYFLEPEFVVVADPTYAPYSSAYTIIGQLLYKNNTRSVVSYDIPVPVLILTGICDDEQ